MHYKKYEIIPYNSEFFTEVADLQKYLWPNYESSAQAYLKWKFEDNPLTKKPFAIVALYKNKVVGFNGFFATRWRIGSKNDKILMLSPADICVHPDHRKKGLFTAMTMFAVEEYEKTPYKTFIGLSINTSSGAGYNKMGWPKIADRTSMRQYSLIGLINWALISKTGRNLYKHQIIYGKFGNIEISNKSRPEEMSAVTTKQKPSNNKITLFKDTSFFKWRFQNIRRNYTFYYHLNNGTIDGYVVIETVDCSTSGHIVDYAETGNGVIYELLRCAIAKKHFDILSIWDVNLRKELSQTLKDLNFSTKTLLGKIEKKFPSEFPMLPVFVRPIKKTVKEKDWFIDGIDIRNINNWEINGICSDNT